MSELNKILELMNEKKDSIRGDYFIPKLWNQCSYLDYKTDENRNGEINVNPYDFFTFTVENGILKTSKDCVANSPLIYSSVARSTTAFNHKNKDQTETGSFIKLIMLLPLLKQFGITILYLLPICSHGQMFMKGELGSPYATKDFYELDNSLHDPLLGEFDKDLLHSEFKALVEACHLLNIKVVCDFAFRTVARDNVLIEKHPDWFYWITNEVSDNFQPPEVKALPKQSKVTESNIQTLYNNPCLAEYISKFRFAPNIVCKDKWNESLNSNKTTAEDIEKSFDLVTAPGFSDVVNDAQPAWTDVTYLKYYFDYPKEVMGYVNENDPPFIMQDGASLNLFHGSDKNTELWNYIVNILPFYHETYSIDGARIDMAHAMPPELKAQIIDKIKGMDKDFILFSEEFDPNNSEEAKNDGFNIISGYTYAVYKDSLKSTFNNSLINETMLASKIPIASAIETPDTPRSIFNFKNKNYVKMLYLMNCLLPNSIPMLNCGNELYEVQPDNLGLDNTEKGKFVLEKNDPMYGKLAFFDNYMLHWNSKSSDMIDLICKISEIRKANKALLQTDNFIDIVPYLYEKMLTPLFYVDRTFNSALLFLANRSVKKTLRFNINKLMSRYLDDDTRKNHVQVIYDSASYSNCVINDTYNYKIKPTESVIIKISKEN